MTLSGISQPIDPHDPSNFPIKKDDSSNVNPALKVKVHEFSPSVIQSLGHKRSNLKNILFEGFNISKDPQLLDNLLLSIFERRGRRESVFSIVNKNTPRELVNRAFKEGNLAPYLEVDGQHKFAISEELAQKVEKAQEEGDEIVLNRNDGSPSVTLDSNNFTVTILTQNDLDKLISILKTTIIYLKENEPKKMAEIEQKVNTLRLAEGVRNKIVEKAPTDKPQHTDAQPTMNRTETGRSRVQEDMRKEKLRYEEDQENVKESREAKEQKSKLEKKEATHHEDQINRGSTEAKKQQIKQEDRKKS